MHAHTCGSSLRTALSHSYRRPTPSRASVHTQAATMDAQSDAATAVPSHFRKLVASKMGESFRAVARPLEVETPQPGEGEVLLRITYAGVNGGCETFRARAEHMFQKNKDLENYALGAEGVGVVVKLGPGVTDLSIGQHVASNGANAFAEYAVTKAAMCTPITEATAEACALALSGLFACIAIDVAGSVTPGSNVLISAGAGAAGSFAVQFAKLAGARVVTTVGSAAKAALAKELGADVVINHREVDDLQAAFSAACPEGFDVVMEGVGGAMQAAAIECLAPEGRVLVTGYISEYPHTAGAGGGDGQRREIPPSEVLFWQSQRAELGDGKFITGSIWPKDVGRILECKKKTLDLYQAGKLRAVVDSNVFCGIESVPNAIDYMLTGVALGKVVVKF